MAAVGLLSASLTSVTAFAEVPDVATDIAPVHSLVARVMEGLGEPSLVVRPGSSPHGHSMRPSEARALERADVVFWIGPELEPWLGGAIESLAADAMTVALLDAPGTKAIGFRSGATFGQHSDEGGGHEGAHDHPPEGHDPHAWLDPENGKVWLGVIADVLSQLDPGNAAVYAGNAEAGRVEIDAVQSKIDGLLGPYRGLRFVVFHDAYRYFEESFGVGAAGAISLSDAATPGPARISEIRVTVQQLGVDCVLSEPQFKQSLVRTVIEGTSARAGAIDPLGSGIETGPDFYPELLWSVAVELVDCARTVPRSSE